MRCTHCDYLLFNLLGRTCPECGRLFSVTQYHFEPGDVSFDCPHCAQAYYGNTAQGLPHPPAFRCVTCGMGVTLEDLIVRPRSSQAEGRLHGRSPWDRRNQLGTMKAWWETVKMLLGRPGQFFTEHAGKSNMEAWLFASIVSWVIAIPNALLQAGFQYFLGVPFGIAEVMGMIALGFASALWIPVGAAFMACLIRIGLIGVHSNRTFGDVYRIVLYSTPPALFSIIPVIGGFASIWQVVIEIIGVSKMYGISGGRAAAAVLLPSVILVILVVIAVFIILI